MEIDSVSLVFWRKKLYLHPNDTLFVRADNLKFWSNHESALTNSKSARENLFFLNCPFNFLNFPVIIFENMSSTNQKCPWENSKRGVSRVLSVIGKEILGGVLDSTHNITNSLKKLMWPYHSVWCVNNVGDVSALPSMLRFCQKIRHDFMFQILFGQKWRHDF